MPSKDQSNCDSPTSEAKEALAYYKSQIQQLESELADFQSSSKELEQELEKELEASEKQHRDLRNKNEGLRYEVEEWKVCLSNFSFSLSLRLRRFLLDMRR